jgi:hypothetical protein
LEAADGETTFEGIKKVDWHHMMTVFKISTHYKFSTSCKLQSYIKQVVEDLDMGESGIHILIDKLPLQTCCSNCSLDEVAQQSVYWILIQSHDNSNTLAR